jgi:hypothetical protein
MITFDNQVTQHTWTLQNTGQTFTVNQSSLSFLNTIQQGLQGVQGIPGNTLPAVNFAFGDATPTTIYTATANIVIKTITVIITTAFNGTGANISIGTLASPTLLMDIDESDVSLVAGFETSPNETILSGTVLKLFITPGAGASQGAGKILIEYATA